eukprot:gene10245-15752_t
MESMKQSTAIMGKVNAQMDPVQMQKIMQEFQLQNEKMGHAGEMMDDALDTLDLDDDYDEETAAVMDQVIDEICTDIKVSSAVPSRSLPAASRASDSSALAKQGVTH